MFIEQGAPKSKAVLGFDLSRGPWAGNVKVIHFGPQTLGTFSGTAGGVPNARYKAKTSADLSATYSFSENTKLTVGGANIFIAPVTAGDGVNPPPTTPYRGLDHFGLTVSGIDAIAADLKAKGVEFTKEPTTIRPGVRICFIRGPQGISIELLERDKKYA